MAEASSSSRAMNSYGMCSVTSASARQQRGVSDRSRRGGGQGRAQAPLRSTRRVKSVLGGASLASAALSPSALISSWYSLLPLLSSVLPERRTAGATTQPVQSSSPPQR